MTRFLTLIALIVTLGLPLASEAQQAREELDDRGYIQAFLEDNLSDAGRDIRIVGFAGALSSQATIEQITIADEDGVWLTLNGVVLSWSRTALLSGRIDIDALTADEILLPRQPNPVGGVPAPEASGFSLPELPVSVDIAEIRANRVVLGAPVFGAAATLALKGEAHLEGGAGSVVLTVDRIDGPKGTLSLNGAYDNADTMLKLAINLDEDADGIAANVLNLPGRPSTQMSVVGTGPAHDFVADLALSTDGQDRLQGQITLLGAAPEPNIEDAAPLLFSAEFSGDLAPIFLPEYRDFFGDQVAFSANGTRMADGALTLETMNVTTDALSLSGNLTLSAGGWPEKFALNGRLEDPSGGPVLLPLSGVKTQLSGADISLKYDRALGEEWQANGQFTGLKRDEISVERGQIQGTGKLVRGEGVAIGQVSGDVTVAAVGVAPKDDALATAIGPDVSGKLEFLWREQAPLIMSNIEMSGDNFRLTGGLSAEDLSTGITVNTRDEVTLSADDLAQFSQLAGTSLNGALRVAVSGTANLLGGAFDLSIAGQGRDLSINQPYFDPLIAGDSVLDVNVIRDNAGTRIPQFTLITKGAEATLSAALKTDATQGDFAIRVKDMTLVDPGLRGEAELTGSVQQTGDLWSINMGGTAPGDSTLAAKGTVQIVDGSPENLIGDIQAKISSLVAYQTLAGRAISGAIDMNAQAEMTLSNGAFTATIEGAGRNLAMGIAAVDPLISGPSQLSAKLSRRGDTPVLLEALKLTTGEIDLTATGQSNDTENRLDFAGTLRDLSIVANGVNGPARADGTAVLQGDNWQVSVNAEGPGGAKVHADGTVRADGASANLKLDGSAHLALMNPLIQPRLISGQAGFDLALNGPLSLSSLTGDIRVPAGRLELPTRRLSFDLNDITVLLSGGRAQVDVAASVPEGGQISIIGPVNLTAPYEGNLQISARQLHLSDGNLFDTTLDGTATLRGALSGGAKLVADLSLGPTEIRVPETAPSSLPIMAGLSHVNEPASVRQTRRFAGLILDPGASGPTLAYPIDIRLRAPGQMFVRGRGLDAELGGELRLTGTSIDIVPQGQFNLIRGRLDILGKRLALTEGQVNLQGGFDPFLHFMAQSDAQDAQVYISVDGPASAPDVSFTSSPERPQDEVLALLLFGRDITEISPLQALRMAAAVRTLAGKGGEGIVSKLRGSFGLDDLDVSTDADGVATVKAGKYISENIYTDVTVGSDGTNEINLNLNLTPSLTARGSVGSDGESKLGVFFERDY